MIVQAGPRPSAPVRQPHAMTSWPKPVRAVASRSRILFRRGVRLRQGIVLRLAALICFIGNSSWTSMRSTSVFSRAGNARPSPVREAASASQ
jgi:hypothetical protein